MFAFSSEEDLSSDSEKGSDPLYRPELNASSLSELNFRESDQEVAEALQENLDYDLFSEVNVSVGCGSSSSAITGSVAAENQEHLEIPNNAEPVQETTEPDLNSQSNTVDHPNSRKKTRKRISDKKNWVKTKIKAAVNSGTVYMNPNNQKTHGKEKKVKDVVCNKDCHYNCSQAIASEERQKIFDDFWRLSKDMKKMFYLKTTKTVPTKTKTKKKAETRRSCTLRYCFVVNTKTVRICKTFYLATLDISERRVYYAHSNVATTGVPNPKAVQVPRNKTSNEDIELVKKHIESFPCVESHYTRAKSTRKFLEANLNIRKMYELYQEYCRELARNDVSEFKYREIFNTQFNLSFHIPKADRCDVCEEKRVSEENRIEMDQEVKDKYEAHVKSKIETKIERDVDRSNLSIPLLCFDLENVFPLPRGNVSSFFYKRKITTFNLTAILSFQRRTGEKINEVYCCIWSEFEAGRGANEIASGLVAILEKVLDTYPDICQLITWSDSCVSQNRNSIISFAIQDVLRKFPRLEQVVMKYCEPGHSSIQEVDAVHSTIERGLKHLDLFSPLDLVTKLLKVKRIHPFNVLQMTQSKFFDFQKPAKLYKYSLVPYSKVKQLEFRQDNAKRVCFKTSLSGDLQMATISQECTSVKKCPNTSAVRVVERLVLPKLCGKKIDLPEAKIKDVKYLLKFIPNQDKEYFETKIEQYYKAKGDAERLEASPSTRDPCPEEDSTEAKRRPAKKLNKK